MGMRGVGIWGGVWQGNGFASCLWTVEGKASPAPQNHPGTRPAAGPRAGLCCGAKTSRGHQRAEEMPHPSSEHPPKVGAPGGEHPIPPPSAQQGDTGRTQRPLRSSLQNTLALVHIYSGVEHAVVSPHLATLIPNFPREPVQGWALGLGFCHWGSLKPPLFLSLSPR